MNPFGQTLLAKRYRRVIAALLLIAAGATSAHAESVYKCRDVRGQIAYQDHACADPARQTLIELAPAPVAAPAQDGERTASPRTVQRNLARSSGGRTNARSSQTLSYECRSADGVVFYKHSRCPKTITVAAPSDRRGSGRKGSARASAARSSAVSERPLPRAEMCKRMASGGSIGRSGREHDDAVSTYDRNVGRDPCRHS